MAAKTRWRGHPIIHRPSDGLWCYEDNLLSVASNPNRPCALCGQANTEEGHDPCLGTLPGVMNACCGHGDESNAYVQYDDGRRVGGKNAIEEIEQLKQKNQDVA